MRASTTNFKTVVCTGGPCNGKPVSVYSDQAILKLSHGNAPEMHVYTINWEHLTAEYTETCDVKQWSVG